MNAKELILAKINAGSKLAKVYLFLVTLGYDLKDIVSFMTSPAAEFINSMSESNIFNDLNISVKQAIEIARGNYYDYVKSFLKSPSMSKVITRRNMSKVIEAIRKGTYKNPVDKGINPQGYSEVENVILAVKELDYIKNNIFKTELEKRRKLSKDENFNEKSELKKIESEFDLDVNEFEHVFNGADEFTKLGTVLGLNQGLKTSKYEQLEFILKIQKIYKDRVDSWNKEHEDDEQIEYIPIDVKRFLIDQEYQDEVVDLYDQVKECSNVFDILRTIPQYKAIMEIYACTLESDEAVSIKSKLANDVYDKLIEKGYYVSEDYFKRMLNALDTILVSKYAETLDIQIPYKKGTKLISEYGTVTESSNEGLLKFETQADLASFKFMFENYIIPNLKLGIVTDYVDGKVVERVEESLKNNEFVSSLMKSMDKNIPLYKCDLDMLTVDSSPYSRVKLHQYVRGLQELSKIKINGIPVSDLFMLYNILINKNKYGSDRFTTLFESFIDSNKDTLYLINDYLKFIGNEDYNAKLEDYDYNLNDIMYLSSVTRSSLNGISDPSFILRTDKGSVFMIKSGYDYVSAGEIVPKVSEETDELKIERIRIKNQYFVNGGLFSSIAAKYLENLYDINANTLDTLTELISKGIIEFKRVCK